MGRIFLMCQYMTGGCFPIHSYTPVPQINFLFYLFSIKFLYYLISLNPLFNLCVSIFIQSYVYSDLHVLILYINSI
jgi:hypothetical protein